MIDCKKYLAYLTEQLGQKFSDRLLYIGLQGSYLRGEADEDSDFDVMLVLDELTPADLDAYREILQNSGHYEKSCGFVCGREDLANWNPLELCHLLHHDHSPAFWSAVERVLPDHKSLRRQLQEHQAEYTL